MYPWTPISIALCVLCVSSTSETKVLGRPSSPECHSYIFWSTTKQLVLQLHHLKTSARNIILSYFRTGLVKLPEDAFDRMATARNMYRQLDITFVPSKKTLDKEKKNECSFVKSLLKRRCGHSQALQGVLETEAKFRCRINDRFSRDTCTELRNILAQTKAFSLTLKRLLEETLGVPPLENKERKTWKFERKLQTHLRRTKSVDARNLDQLKNILADDKKRRDVTGSRVEHFGVSRTRKHPERNKASVAVLYAVFEHFQQTLTDLEYVWRPRSFLR